MGASSVTGTGQGASNGVYNPEHHGGCGCQKPGDPQETRPSPPTGCVVRYRTGNSVVVKVGQATGVRVCG